MIASVTLSDPKSAFDKIEVESKEASPMAVDGMTIEQMREFQVATPERKAYAAEFREFLLAGLAHKHGGPAPIEPVVPKALEEYEAKEIRMQLCLIGMLGAL